MTAEQGIPGIQEPSLAPRVAVAAVCLVVLAALGAWLHTVRELNRLTAYEVVGAEALRLAQAKQLHVSR